MMTIKRYARAFIGALRLTLRGEVVQPIAERYPQLTAWWQDTLRLTAAVFAAADANGIPKSARETLVLHVEGRDISMETILKTVHFHADQELPLLMRREDSFNYLTLQATVLNDRFLVSKLAQAENLPLTVKGAVEALSAHLETLPRKESL